MSSMYSPSNLKDLKYDMVAEFAIEHVTNPDQKVRKAATGLITALHTLIGGEKLEPLLQNVPE